VRSYLFTFVVIAFFADVFVFFFADTLFLVSLLDTTDSPETIMVTYVLTYVQ
jgi:hypothetical protein